MQWIVYFAEVAVYCECKNNPNKLTQFKNSKHSLECHLRSGNFDRIVLDKDLAATDDLIRYLLYLLIDCIAKDKTKSVTEKTKLDLDE